MFSQIKQEYTKQGEMIISGYLNLVSPLLFGAMLLSFCPILLFLLDWKYTLALLFLGIISSLIRPFRILITKEEIIFKKYVLFIPYWHINHPRNKVIIDELGSQIKDIKDNLVISYTDSWEEDEKSLILYRGKLKISFMIRNDEKVFDYLCKIEK